MSISRTTESFLSFTSLACYGLAAYAARKVPLAASCKAIAAAARLIGKDNAAKEWDKTGRDYWTSAKKTAVRDLTAIFGFIAMGLTAEYAAEALKEKPKPNEESSLPEKEEEPKNEEPSVPKEEPKNEEPSVPKEEQPNLYVEEESLFSRKNKLRFSLLTTLYALHRKGIITIAFFKLILDAIEQEIRDCVEPYMLPVIQATQVALTIMSRPFINPPGIRWH